jgi:hypothetical protein
MLPLSPFCHPPIRVEKENDSFIESLMRSGLWHNIVGLYPDTEQSVLSLRGTSVTILENVKGRDRNGARDIFRNFFGGFPAEIVTWQPITSNQ